MVDKAHSATCGVAAPSLQAMARGALLGEVAIRYQVSLVVILRVSNMMS